MNSFVRPRIKILSVECRDRRTGEHGKLSSVGPAAFPLAPSTTCPESKASWAVTAWYNIYRIKFWDPVLRRYLSWGGVRSRGDQGEKARGSQSRAASLVLRAGS